MYIVFVINKKETPTWAGDRFSVLKVLLELPKEKPKKSKKPKKDKPKKIEIK